MPSHRGLRIAEAIREVVSASILFDVADPRVRAVTVLNVDVAGDLRNATIHVSVMGTSSEQQMAMKGRKSATGFLQAKVAARLQTRFTPILVFKRDDSVKRSVEMSRLIDETLAADRESIQAESSQASSQPRTAELSPSEPAFDDITEDAELHEDSYDDDDDEDDDDDDNEFEDLDGESDDLNDAPPENERPRRPSRH